MSKSQLSAYFFIAPFMIIFVIFMGYPVFYSFYLSFHQVVDYYDMFGGMKFVGFAHYIKLMGDSQFWWSILMTLYYAALFIPLNIAASFFLAVLLHNKLRGSRFFRTAYFMPNVLDTLVVGVIWIFIYLPNGPLDHILSAIGITNFSSTGFLGNPLSAMPAVVFAMVLKSAGFGMILFLAAIQNIPKSVYEAADIDGASPWQKVVQITFPLVKPIVLFLSVIGAITALNAFAEIYAMTSGGPYQSVGSQALGVTNLSGYYLYRTFESARYGYAAAISYVLLIITLVISTINMKFLSEK
ncbi:MAG: hypothetical protein B6244_13185 [Candidatus Cloacimonetes bacterium 4572_55]|nr:MAG: hypothetical protein B6244_13185 [Candidatus Cloacimonetes bacterium 4572_55]